MTESAKSVAEESFSDDSTTGTASNEGISRDVMVGDKKLTVSNIMEFGFGNFEMDDDTFKRITDSTIQNIKEDEIGPWKNHFP